MGLGGEGVLTLLAKQEDFGIMYAPFCPYHAHCFHTEEAGECPQWQKELKHRQKTSAQAIQKAAQQKMAKRGDEYAAAQASSRSGTRF